MNHSLFISLIVFVLQQTTLATTLSDAAQIAVKADMAFILQFLQDYNTANDAYYSYMYSSNMVFPQTIMNCYLMVATGDLDKLTSGVASQFPFSNFKTFALAFPWYSSLLRDVSATKLYVPSDFTTSDLVVSSIISQGSVYATQIVTLGGDLESQLGGTTGTSVAASETSSGKSLSGSTLAPASTTKAFNNQAESKANKNFNKQSLIFGLRSLSISLVFLFFSMLLV